MQTCTGAQKFAGEFLEGFGSFEGETLKKFFLGRYFAEVPALIEVEVVIGLVTKTRFCYFGNIERYTSNVCITWIQCCFQFW